MSLLDRPPASPPQNLDADPVRPSHVHRIVAAVAVLLLVAGGVLAVVHALDSAALEQVQVFLDAKPVTCADPSDVTTVPGGGGFDEDTYRVPAVKGTRGLDCVLSVVVQNSSDREVELQAINLPFFGPDSGMGVRSDRALTQQSEPRFVNDDRDVIYTWGSNPLITLGADDTFTYRIHLTSDGCRQAGATTVIDAPIATVTTGIATRDVSLSGAGFGVLGAKAAAQHCR